VLLIGGFVVIKWMSDGHHEEAPESSPAIEVTAPDSLQN
jgi:hypothetical protein